MFMGTNLIQGKDIRTQEYESYWFEYPAKVDGDNQNWETYNKTEAVKDKDGKVTGRRVVQLNGKDWSGIKPTAQKFEELKFESEEARNKYVEDLASEALTHLESRYPDVPGLFSLLRLATKGSEQELRSELAPKKLIDMSEMRKRFIDNAMLMDGGLFDPTSNKLLKTRAEITEYVARIMPDRPAETEEQAA